MIGSIATFANTLSNRELLLPVFNYDRTHDKMLKRRLVAISTVNEREGDYFSPISLVQRNLLYTVIPHGYT
jgi:hypothetical protein